MFRIAHQRFEQGAFLTWINFPLNTHEQSGDSRRTIDSGSPYYSFYPIIGVFAPGRLMTSDESIQQNLSSQPCNLQTISYTVTLDSRNLTCVATCLASASSVLSHDQMEYPTFDNLGPF